MEEGPNAGGGQAPGKGKVSTVCQKTGYTHLLCLRTYAGVHRYDTLIPTTLSCHSLRLLLRCLDYYLDSLTTYGEGYWFFLSPE